MVLASSRARSSRSSRTRSPTASAVSAAAAAILRATRPCITSATSRGLSSSAPRKREAGMLMYSRSSRSCSADFWYSTASSLDAGWNLAVRSGCGWQERMARAIAVTHRVRSSSEAAASSVVTGEASSSACDVMEKACGCTLSPAAAGTSSASLLRATSPLATAWPPACAASADS